VRAHHPPLRHIQSRPPIN